MRQRRDIIITGSGTKRWTAWPRSPGERQWSQTLAAKPQALLADAKELLLFSGNTAQVLEPPQE